MDDTAELLRHAVDARMQVAGGAWTVLAHRYLGIAIGIAGLIMLALVWRLPDFRPRAVADALGGTLLIVALAGLGFWSEQGGNYPLVWTLQYTLGFALLGLLFAAYLEAAPGGVVVHSGNAGLRWLARASISILLIEIALGGWTSVNLAGTACLDFPTCLGSYRPDVDYVAAFDPRQFLLSQEQAGVPALAARAAMHWVHRLGGGVTFLLLTSLAFGLSSGRCPARLSRAGMLLNVLLFAGIALGIGAVLLRLPVAVVLAHHAVAALLLLTLVYVNVHLRRTAAAPAAADRLQAGVTAPTAIPKRPTEAVPLVPSVEEVPATPAGLFDRLRSQLGKTRNGLTGVLANLALGRKAIDKELLEEIEERLLMADLGVNTTARIIDDLTQGLERHELRDWDVLQARLRQHLLGILRPCSLPLLIPENVRPYVILVVGVNGVGKTTTIGKLAKRLQLQGHSVMLAAGDTFRAAAVEQLQRWGERNGIAVIAQASGSDSASVIFDAVQAAQARKVDVLIADTAGRLHTKSNLMEELRKIKRIIGKLDDAAPHEILLVLDAGTGQNAISQARQFNEAVGLTGIALTKLDGTAKGGVIFALAEQFGIPIRYIGIGEGIDDLQDFDADRFIEALFETRVH
jgi:fused signal recognition particle receptor